MELAYLDDVHLVFLFYFLLNINNKTINRFFSSIAEYSGFIKYAKK